MFLAYDTLFYELLDILGHLVPKYSVPCPKEISLLALMSLVYILEHFRFHLFWHYDSISTGSES